MESDEDISMQLRRIGNVETISKDIALQFAELVFAHNYGKSLTESQQPFSIIDHDDRWEIRGTNVVPSSTDMADPEGGRLIMIMLKTNGRIVTLVKELVSK